MSEAKSLAAINAVKTILEGIEESNGYLTDLGQNVHHGFLAHAIQVKDQTCPFLVIQPNAETLNTPGTLKGKVKLSLNLFVVDRANQAGRLMSAVSDLRRALVRYDDLPSKDRKTVGVNEYRPAEYSPQPESIYSLAALQVSVSFMENYED